MHPETAQARGESAGNMMPVPKNLLAASPSGRAAEEVTALIQNSGLRLEHIVSHGQPSPPGFWYDQPEEEWVLLLRGSATLDFGEEGALDLRSGDCLTIPAHVRHRVGRVSEDAVWVAAHFSKERSQNTSRQ